MDKSSKNGKLKTICTDININSINISYDYNDSNYIILTSTRGRTYSIHIDDFEEYLKTKFGL